MKPSKNNGDFYFENLCCSSFLPILLQINALPVISSDRIINQTLDALLEHRGIGRLKGQFNLLNAYGK